jgi:RNA polymerase sigma-70 factor (ECF subfamily)
LTDEVLDNVAGSSRGFSVRVASAPDRLEALAVLAAIRALPDAYRETLVLRLVEGMTGPEIAARTGLTAASVRVNLHRGMKQLRERLRGSHE